MKKLMIAVAIVCAAALSQAATANWNWAVTGAPASKQVFWDNGSTKTLYATTPAAVIYLFDAAVISQDTLLSGLREGTYSDLSKATSVSSSTLTDASKLTKKTGIAYGTQTTAEQTQTYNFYMAVMDTAGNVFLSNSTADLPSSGTDAEKAISFSGISTATQESFTDDSKATFASDGAGWYALTQAEDTPEPTSGLLFLLGMAGLALRRRRA